jgi:L-ascorbate metabolism protein UlaG (beta-lactamase superfamily)
MAGDVTAETSTRFSATWMGVSTILFEDEQDSILIDGFFTRPGYITTFLGKMRSDEQIVTRCMKQGGIDNRLRAVLAAHSHWDHALDSATICQKTGAKLVGSESTRYIALGQGLSDEQITIVKDGDVLNFGAFRITISEGVHSPGDIAPGEIEKTLQFPCRYTAMKSSKCYSYLIEHGEHRTFVHPSANYVSDKFRGIRCSTLFLGVGVLGKQTPEFREEYWKQTVELMEPKKVIPIHWDNLWKSLDVPITPMPWPFDNWPPTQEWLKKKFEAAGLNLQMPELWQRLDLKV